MNENFVGYNLFRTKYHSECRIIRVFRRDLFAECDYLTDINVTPLSYNINIPCGCDKDDLRDLERSDSCGHTNLAKRDFAYGRAHKNETRGFVPNTLVSL